MNPLAADDKPRSSSYGRDCARACGAWLHCVSREPDGSSRWECDSLDGHHIWERSAAGLWVLTETVEARR